MLSLLITRPHYEQTTHYLYFWAGVLKDEANKRGLKIYDLEKDKANKRNLNSYLRKQNPDIVIINGHGNDVSVTGHDGEALISVGDNEQLLKGCDVFIRACNAGKVLGIEIKKMGAKSFIGYREPFIFYHKEDYIHRPLQDDYAKPFFETSNQVGLSLIKGKDAQEANNDSIKSYKKTISRLLTSNSTDSFLIPYLIWNMNNQVCY